ncbi:ATP-binding protein [Nonomuraea typhae]|uniref:ATP-binding protein n=1 Tax=Nonomuraea typhae TaxID=2603600 RepID=UPI0012F95351|nr:ATP-binding protein [Nonomuraea typhae]
MTALAKGRNVFGWPLTLDPKEVGRARELVHKALAGYQLEPTLLDDTVLAVSELVTNAIRHGTPPIELAVHVLYDRVRICVADASPRQLVPGQPGSHDERGRGLAIVKAVTDGRWWVTTRHPGKEVWAELPRPATKLPRWLVAGVPGQASGGHNPPAPIYT